jgi:hypothetical protein
MIMSKKQTILEGNVIFPLITGQSTHISYNGQLIRTSAVAAIYEVSENQIVFETRNTIYSVVPEKSGRTDSYILWGIPESV